MNLNAQELPRMLKQAGWSQHEQSYAGTVPEFLNEFQSGTASLSAFLAPPILLDIPRHEKNVLHSLAGLKNYLLPNQVIARSGFVAFLFVHVTRRQLLLNATHAFLNGLYVRLVCERFTAARRKRSG